MSVVHEDAPMEEETRPCLSPAYKPDNETQRILHMQPHNAWGEEDSKHQLLYTRVFPSLIESSDHIVFSRKMSIIHPNNVMKLGGGSPPLKVLCSQGVNLFLHPAYRELLDEE